MIATALRNEKKIDGVASDSTLSPGMPLQDRHQTQTGVYATRACKKAGPREPGFTFHNLSTSCYLLTTVYLACGVRIFCETRSVILAVTVYSPGSPSLS